MASHHAGPMGAGMLAAPAKGSATPFPSRGSPTLLPFRNPIFYLSCLSGLGQSEGDSSPGTRPRGRPQAARRLTRPDPTSSFHGSTPALRVLHQQQLPPTEREEEERSGPGQHGFLYKLASSKVFKHLKALF